MSNPADINSDGRVTDSDYFAWVTAITQGDPSADITGDGVVDRRDLDALMAEINGTGDDPWSDWRSVVPPESEFDHVVRVGRGHYGPEDGMREANRLGRPGVKVALLYESGQTFRTRWNAPTIEFAQNSPGALIGTYGGDEPATIIHDGTIYNNNGGPSSIPLRNIIFSNLRLLPDRPGEHNPGLRLLSGDSRNIVFENCVFRDWYAAIVMSANAGRIERVTFRRCDISDTGRIRPNNDDPETQSRAVYFNGCSDVTFEDCVFRRNGFGAWRLDGTDPLADSSEFSHSGYAQTGTLRINLVRCIGIGAGAHFFQQRGGGDMKDCVVVDNGIALLCRPEEPAEITGNLILEQRNTNSDLQTGWGIQVSSPRADVLIADNIIGQPASDATTGSCINIQGGRSFGDVDIRIRNNWLLSAPIPFSSAARSSEVGRARITAENNYVNSSRARSDRVRGQWPDAWRSNRADGSGSMGVNFRSSNIGTEATLPALDDILGTNLAEDLERDYTSWRARDIIARVRDRLPAAG